MGRVYRREGLEAAKRALRAEADRERNPHAALNRFLQDYYADLWPEILACSKTFKTYRDREDRTRYKLDPIRCHNAPFCVICTRRRTNRRVLSALDAFHRCTPKGQKPRFIHIVQTAPATEDGRGWGYPASRRHGEFARIVWETVSEAYGGNVGGVLSYQDFGERAFAKRHPHIDMTLNGWQIRDGQAGAVPHYELKGNGYERWQQQLGQRATRFSLNAMELVGNLKIQRPIIGLWSYYRVLRYQMRELVDLRKISDYRLSQRTIWWGAYNSNTRQKFTVGDFLLGLTEYQTRLGAWSRHEGEGRQNLHFRYGHMADRVITRTAASIGGISIPHGARCPCPDCGDWERVFGDD